MLTSIIFCLLTNVFSLVRVSPKTQSHSSPQLFVSLIYLLFFWSGFLWHRIQILWSHNAIGLTDQKFRSVCWLRSWFLSLTLISRPLRVSHCQTSGWTHFAFGYHWNIADIHPFVSQRIRLLRDRWKWPLIDSKNVCELNVKFGTQWFNTVAQWKWNFSFEFSKQFQLNYSTFETRISRSVNE